VATASCRWPPTKATLSGRVPCPPLRCPPRRATSLRLLLCERPQQRRTLGCAGPGARPSPLHRERAAGGGRGSASAAPGLVRESGLVPTPGAREGAALRAGGGRARRHRRPRRSAGRSAEEERGEEGKGREEAPARLPAKRPYLFGHNLSLPGGRFGAADPLPPGSSSPGAAERARPGWGVGRGRALPASPAPRPPPRSVAPMLGSP
jgi:hypothetical protein